MGKILLSNRKFTSDINNQEDGFSVDIKVDLKNTVFNLDCKLNQYPSNKTLQNLLTYYTWSLSKKFELTQSIITNSYGIIDVDRIMEEKRKILSVNEYVKFSVAEGLCVDFNDKETIESIIDKEELMFNFIKINLENKEEGKSIVGNLSLKDSDIALFIDMDNKLFTVYIGINIMNQDSTNSELYERLMKLPEDVLGRNKNLKYLVLESDGATPYFLDVLRNYLGDEFIRLIVKEI